MGGGGGGGGGGGASGSAGGGAGGEEGGASSNYRRIFTEEQYRMLAQVPCRYFVNLTQTNALRAIFDLT